MWLLKNPQNYDVIVTTNLFGDILSDLCAQLVGGMGFACSGNIGENYAVFEPTHGSAPKYAGQNKVNPIAAILAAKMMAGVARAKRKIARNIEKAVAGVVERGAVRTYDMGGKCGHDGHRPGNRRIASIGGRKEMTTMVQVHSAHRLDQIEIALRMAAERHGGSVLAVSHIGQLLNREHVPGEVDAISFTVCFAELYSPLLNAEVRFAAFLPSRIAACAKGAGASWRLSLPAKSAGCSIVRISSRRLPPWNKLCGRSWKRRRNRTPPAESRRRGGEHRATEDQMNMRAALPQRIDCRGSKIEELAGTGAHDAQGG